MSARILNLRHVDTSFVPQIVFAPKPQAVAGFKIETGIPISEPSLGRPKSPLRQAIESLKVGESFQVKRSEFSSGRIKALAKKINIKVVCRIVSTTHRRIWRTA